jgi:anti-anti-sigma factor
MSETDGDSTNATVGVRSSRTFPPQSSAVRAARAFAADCPAATDVDLEALTLGVSELATNAVLHAATAFVVTLERLPDGVRVSVTDGDPSVPRTGNVDPTATTGRGLAIVRALSRRMQIDPSDPGKTIWFELGAGEPAGPAPTVVQAGSNTVSPSSSWTVERTEQEVVLLFSGPVDLVSAPALGDALSSLINEERRIVVDLGGCDFLDSLGVSVLVAAVLRAQAAEVSLAMRLSEAARRVIWLSGLSDRMEVEP